MHGGVWPWWQHGSSETYSVAPGRSASPQAASAATSACAAAVGGVPALPQRAAVADHHRADQRVGARPPAPLLGELDRAGERSVVGLQERGHVNRRISTPASVPDSPGPETRPRSRRALMSVREAADWTRTGAGSAPYPSPFPEGKVMTFPSHRGGYVAAFTVALSTLALISTAPAARQASERTTFLLSRAADGGFPNGDSRNPAVSHDQRIARVMAYESDASEHRQRRRQQHDRRLHRPSPGPVGAARHAVEHGRHRARVEAAWAAPRPTGPRRSRRSTATRTTPRAASRSSRRRRTSSRATPTASPDVFVRSLSSGAITRVSVDSHGVQGNGTSYDVSIDGDCEQVALHLRLRRTSVARERPQAGLRALPARARATNKKFNGQTFLASASTKGAAGNGDSGEPAVRARRQGGRVHVAGLEPRPAATATASSDVYERTSCGTFYKHVSDHKGEQVLRFGTALVSATRAGKAGNGASSTPSVTDDGRFVAYQTLASNLLTGDRNGVSDVAEADMKGKRVKQSWVSKSKATRSATGRRASRRSRTRASSSSSSRWRRTSSPRSPCTTTRTASRTCSCGTARRATSRSSRATGTTATSTSPSGTPATSSRGNYVPFVTRSKMADRQLSSLAAYGPTVDLVYLRYMGAK